MSNIEIHKVGNVLDASTSKIEQEAITQILDQGKNVALDLSECSYVSSAGLRVMLYSYKIAATEGLKLYLVGVSDEVREVMAITGFERFFIFYNNIEECINQSE
ncbi:MAG: STAS domain-containing protein [Candidatus Phocaeicola faecigallinarum]|uniref:Anti-sigma factor antagonist n=1 Tax=Candidatus Phocaeicola faecigallinarum TaxID=2838732 RepID=A0A948TA88_9BACT|nr:STAS domain-containing protein [Candidatus Phocaeicola faecigallinarum]